MVKLLSFAGKSLSGEFESLQKSTLSMLFLCSIVSNGVLARKDDNSQDAKISQPYRFNYDVEDSEDGSETGGWNMKGSYGYRNPNAGEYRMVEYNSEDYGFIPNGKSNEPNVSPSNPADVVLRKEGSYEMKGQTASPKMNLKAMVQQSLKQEEEDEALEQKPERYTKEEETTTLAPMMITTTTGQPSTTASPSSSSSSSPMFGKLLSSSNSINGNSGREIEGRPSTSTQSPASSDSFNGRPGKETKKSLINKLSVHQLISESMPTLQMSVVPVYFVNKATKSLVAVPYLVMKSISKMPLLPSMLDQANGQQGGSANLINYVNTPFNQRLRARPIDHLSSILDSPSSSYDDGYSRSNGHHNNDQDQQTWLTVNGNSHQQFNSHYWR